MLLPHEWSLINLTPELIMILLVMYANITIYLIYRVIQTKRKILKINIFLSVLIHHSGALFGNLLYVHPILLILPHRIYISSALYRRILYIKKKQMSNVRKTLQTYAVNHPVWQS